MSRYVVAILAIAWAIASVPLGLLIWPSAAGNPPGQLLPVFVVILLFEGAAFAGGVIVLVQGARLLSSFGQSPLLTRLTYVSLAWLLLNWWPHDGLHRSAFGRTFEGLAVIDIVFHTTLIAAGGVVALFFFRALKTFVTPRDTAQPIRPADTLHAR